MAQPQWITPAGSLGVIPEGVYYQQSLRAFTEPLSNTPTCTSSSSTNNSITCTSTAGLYKNLQVEFASNNGSTFGGIQEGVRYFVFDVIDSTRFRIADSEFATSPNALTAGTGDMTAVFSQHVYYSLIAGSLPTGLQIADNGSVVGVPKAVASLQGVPVDVAFDVESKFAVRGYTKTPLGTVDRIADRTFTITVTGNDVPKFTTPAGSIGTFYDGDRVSIQVEYIDEDPGEANIVTLASGELPPGLTVSASGLISGYIRPVTPIDQTPGYDETATDTEPYDFVVDFVSRNYQFTLEVNDGKSSDLRTFTMFVYARNEMTADAGAWYLQNGQPWDELTPPTEAYFVQPSWATADNSFITADQTNNRAPFLVNAMPSNLGTVRSDNKYAYQFIGDDYDTEQISYAINVNEGAGLPPGLALDPETGWFYGEIPDQGTTEVEYSFNIVVYQTQPVGDAVACTSTSATNNRITCASTLPLAGISDWYSSNPDPLYIPIKLSGTALGGLSTAGETIYYVLHVYNEFEFSVAASTSSTTPLTLTTSSGSMSAGILVASAPFPFTLTITGDIDSEITWLTDSNLGSIINGSTSLLKVEAVNRGGRDLSYKLASGAFNSLPPGLQLLPTGEIAGRVTFNTFAIDLGATTFDNNQTTWDSQFTFTVNAYAPDTQQILYNVSEVVVTNGGSGYSSLSPPVLQFNTPIGASAVQAQVGNITISGGAITAVEVINSGAGYTGVATLTEVSGAGSGATFSVVMRQTGTRDVVSVFKTFTMRVIREYNAPYQNLYVQAMPPADDRVLIASLLEDESIFVPEYIFRPTDPNFGKATAVTYQHAFGLAPDALDVYVESLYLNHYWKNLTLGEIQTAQALDSEGNVVYEIVYSKIIDNLTNNAGESVDKIVPLPYSIIDPVTGETVREVYPNSLVNMRDQVIDTVGQISTGLPLWMTSKQENGRVLGFTPAWVICYTNPGRSKQIAYYLTSQFGQRLNVVDFKVDRYILDRALSRNWNTATQDWTPQPSLTTFDRFNTSGYSFIGNVSIATNLAFSDVDGRTLEYISDLGGLDGQINQISGDTIVFVKQQDYDGPPGSSYSTTDQAWQDTTTFFGDEYDPLFVDNGSGGRDPSTNAFNGDPGSFDNSNTVPGGYQAVCTATSATTNEITCDSTANMTVGDIIWFTGTAFGSIVPFSPTNQIYYVYEIVDATHFKITAAAGGTTPVTLTGGTGSLVADFGNQRMAIWRISVDATTQLVSLTLETQTAPNQFIQISRGSQYRSAQLFRPLNPGEGLTRVSWLPFATVVTTETTFDQGSMEFIEPIDTYNPGDTYDKYLVFPKQNILV